MLEMVGAYFDHGIGNSSKTGSSALFGRITRVHRHFSTLTPRCGLNAIDTECKPPPKSRQSSQIVAWHSAHVSNGATEAINNLVKRVKRAAFGFTRFRNYRIRSLLYAGKPNWDLLATITPR